MICKNCSTELNSLDYHCPSCGVRTGVEAKRSFKWSIGCSGIGCSVALLCILGIYLLAAMNQDHLSGIGLGLIMILALGSSLIGVVFAMVGLAKKNYKLVRKGK